MVRGALLSVAVALGSFAAPWHMAAPHPTAPQPNPTHHPLAHLDCWPLHIHTRCACLHAPGHFMACVVLTHDQLCTAMPTYILAEHLGCSNSNTVGALTDIEPTAQCTHRRCRWQRPATCAIPAGHEAAQDLLPSMTSTHGPCLRAWQWRKQHLDPPQWKGVPAIGGGIGRFRAALAAGYLNLAVCVTPMITTVTPEGRPCVERRPTTLGSA